jgi:hypothetical protein
MTLPASFQNSNISEYQAFFTIKIARRHEVFNRFIFIVLSSWFFVSFVVKESLIFFLALQADTSIIEHSGFDSFEAATALFVIS